jgi:hypothetical protein
MVETQISGRFFGTPTWSITKASGQEDLLVDSLEYLGAALLVPAAIEIWFFWITTSQGRIGGYPIGSNSLANGIA